MSSLQATPAWARAPLRLRAARRLSATGVAKRLFLDRQIDFWLGELHPAWSLTELRGRVVQVIDETHDVKTFVLEPGAGWPGHRAGQYVPVEVEIDGARVRRCYSISSAPGDGHVAITVKRVPGGRVSGFLHDHVHEGSVIGLGTPAGDFVLGGSPSAGLLLLSGGSGATPGMAILRDMAARGAVRSVVYVQAARSAADVIFRDELRALAKEHPGLRLVFRLDDEATTGPLDEAELRALVPDFAERETLLCGPPGMMDAMERIWSRAGARDRLRTERFVAARPPAATADGVSPAPVALGAERARRPRHAARTARARRRAPRVRLPDGHLPDVPLPQAHRHGGGSPHRRRLQRARPRDSASASPSRAPTSISRSRRSTRKGPRCSRSP